MSDELARLHSEITFFIEHGRWAEAAQRLSRALSADPDNPWLHGQLARCRLATEAWDEALESANQVVALAPDMGWGHYLRAIALEGRDRGDRPVEDALRSAVELEPDDPDFLTALSRLEFKRSKHHDALATVDRALAVDPQHDDARLMRAQILAALGNQAEADELNASVLASTPDDPDAHVQVGFVALRAGNHRQARSHFLEALRLHPGHEGARVGLVTSIKARNPLYRLLLGWCYLCHRLGGYTWVILFGIVVARRVLNQMADSMPALAPVFVTASWAILVFALFTWIAEHVANALLLFHPVGRHALRRWERLGASAVAVSLLIGIGWVAAWASDLVGDWLPGLIIASFALPLGAALDDDLNRRQRPVAIGLMALVVAVGIAALLVPEDLAGPAFLIYALLWVGFTWLHQILAALLR